MGEGTVAVDHMGRHLACGKPVNFAPGDTVTFGDLCAPLTRESLRNFVDELIAAPPPLSQFSLPAFDESDVMRAMREGVMRDSEACVRSMFGEPTHYEVASEKAKAALVARGVPEDKIRTLPSLSRIVQPEMGGTPPWLEYGDGAIPDLIVTPLGEGAFLVAPPAAKATESADPPAGRSGVQDHLDAACEALCPFCGERTLWEKCKSICRSAICRYRIVGTCCDG